MRNRSCVIRFAIILLLLVMPVGSTYAASIVVGTLADDNTTNGNCTLREAILSANTNSAFDACSAGSGADTITFSVSGTITVMATAPLPTITSQVTIDGGATGGSTAPAIRIDGNTLSTVATDDEWGLYLGAGSSSSTIRDIMITRFGDGGILIESASNSILGNWIGTDGATAGLGNGPTGFGGGIRIRPGTTSDASNNTVGGTTPADRNLIEGNTGPGISVLEFNTADGFGVLNTLIQGNFFGTNPAGTAAGPSGGENGSGISTFSAGNLTIGGTTGTTPGGNCTGACNLISRSQSFQLNLSGASDGTFVSGTTILGNYIGTDVAGTAALGCYLSGTCGGMQWGYGISGTIGGTTAAARNIIAGNAGGNGEGIYFFNTVNGTATAAPVTIAGNYIGVGSSGASLPNGSHGIWTNPAESLTIGGATVASRNVIAANGGAGIQIDGGNDLVNTGVNIRNNYIGVLPDGTTAAGNGAAGVNLNFGIASAMDFALVQDNVIANNTGAGVIITGNNNQVRTNSLYNNGGLGIDQEGNGTVEINDNCDPDSGANDLQNYPVITAANVASGNATISGTLNSLASSSFTLDFFGNTTAGDEGRIYLGSTTVATNGSCTGAFTAGPFATTLAGGDTVTATATNNAAANPDTSELSAAVTVVVTVATPTVTKTFTPSTIASGAISTLSIQIQNNDAATISNVAFTDTYPVQITTAGTPNITNTCGGSTSSNATSFTLSGGSIPGNGTCTATIAVTSSTLGGPYTNNVTVTSGAPSANGSADLTVVAPPTVTKSFSPASLFVGATSTLTISLGNANASSITGVNLTDTFPSGLVIANPSGATNNCGGSLTATAGSGSLTLIGGTIPNGGCTITVGMTSASAATYNNTIATTDVTSSAGSPTAAASDSVTFTSPMTATKSFSPNPVAPGEITTLTITITNPNSFAATGVGFTDNYPAGMTNALTPNAGTTCVGGVITANPGGTSLVVSGITVPANSSCSVSVNVTATSDGVNTIASGGITSSNAGSTTAATTAALTIQTVPIPTLSPLLLFIMTLMMAVAGAFVMKR